jgi:hypothetical protein
MEPAFVQMISPGLTILIERGLEGQHHSIQQFIENMGHDGFLRAPEPEDANGPAHRTSLLDTPE